MPKESTIWKIEIFDNTDYFEQGHQPDEQNEAEEGRAPETPTYSSVMMQRSDRTFMLEQNRPLSLSMSTASEMDDTEPSNMDQLRSVLQAERKALSVLYVKLEEERSVTTGTRGVVEESGHQGLSTGDWTRDSGGGGFLKCHTRVAFWIIDAVVQMSRATNVGS
jgi:hypothetical protein